MGILRSFPGMTTKLLQHSINPLTRAPNNFFAENHQSSIQHSSHPSEICLQQAVPSMDRILESRSVESMKKMMLMQEQVFKQQVQELHRIYNLQKKLMNERKDEPERRTETTEQTERINPEFAVKTRDDHKELSCSKSGESTRMLINFDLENPIECTPSRARCFEEQKGFKRLKDEADLEVDLTLSIGHCTRKQKSKSTQFTQLQDSDKPNGVQETGSSSAKGEEHGEPSSIISSSSAYQDNTRPHGLHRDLSLNRT